MNTLAAMFRGKALTLRVLGEPGMRRLSEFKRVHRANCLHGLAPYACVFCTKTEVVADTEAKPRRIFRPSFKPKPFPAHLLAQDIPALVFPPRTTPPVPRLGEPEKIDGSGGFRWNDLVFHRRGPVLQKMPRTGEAARDAVNDAAPDSEPAPVLPPWFKSYDIYVVGEKLPRKSAKGFDNRTRRSRPVCNRFTGEREFVDPQFAPLCESRTYGTYARLPVDTLPEPAKRELDYWNKVLAAEGMPQEPHDSKIVVLPGESKRKRRRAGDEPSDDETVVAADRNGIGGDVYIYDEPEMNHDDLRLLTMYFRGATPEEVLEAGQVAQWAYQVSVDPMSRGDFTKTQRRAIERRLEAMRKRDEGRCITGVCPGNQCANPELSYSERREIHRANTVKFDSIGNLGRWFFWVKLNGRYELKFLPLPLGETNPKLVQATFRQLVRREVRAVNRADKAERRAAFGAVEGLHFMEVVWNEDNGKTYVWDRLAKRVKVVDDVTGEVHDFEGLPPAANAAD